MAGTHTHKAMLTLTADELKLLIDGLDQDRGYMGTVRDGEASDALRKRLVFALEAITPR